jgi:chemotaxis protein MotB
MGAQRRHAAQMIRPAHSMTRSAASGDASHRSVRPLAAAASGEENYWWSITLSDLTLLLLGFALLWYASTGGLATKSAAPPAPLPNSEVRGAPALPQVSDALWRQVRQDWTEFVASGGLQKDLEIESSDGEILLSLHEAVTFASGKAELRPRALPVLEKAAATLLQHADLSAAIGGHTDSLRIASAEFPSNWELSTARASRVARYLIAKGVHPARLSVQGYANFRPRESNSSALNRRANRRVEIRLWQKTKS